MTLIRTIVFVALVVLILAGAIAGVSFAQRRLNEIRTTSQLTETAPLLNAPPLIAFTTVALGGFRGLLADYLWLRANRLQEEGNYFEMVQLASWIVKLQPRFTGATAFLAWNMSYNISVTFNSFEDRWRWVQRGIELIRDEALDYNPGDPELCKELAWIYLHKMGQDMDDANRYYKVQMATQMTNVLGEPPADWAALAVAPASPEELRTALGTKTVFWQRLEEAKLTFEDFERAFRKTGTFPAEIQADTLPAGDRTSVELCLRRRWLKAAFRLEPAQVEVLNRRYGKLDWRLPQAHALYWAHRGMELAPGQKDLGCERIIFQGLSAAFKSGRLIFLRDVQAFETTPNLDLLEAANNSYLDSMAKHPENSSIKGGYENFLIDAIVILYSFGQRKQAEVYLGSARRLYPGPKFARNVDDFVLAELAEDMTSASHAQAQGTVQGYLVQSYYALALGDEERAGALELIARRLWQKYMNEIGDSSKERRGLPPYATMRSTAVDRCMEIFPAGLAGRLRELLPKAPAGSAAPPPGTPPPPAADAVPR